MGEATVLRGIGAVNGQQVAEAADFAGQEFDKPLKPALRPGQAFIQSAAAFALWAGE
ncbi:MAG: hypothetical protein KJ063_09380 [Anaerolineae bacterium]|nr:hypothetical protein [Anaerolineae bacterium]